MDRELKIGNVVKVNIAGVYTSCIVVDIKSSHILSEDEYGLIMTFSSATATYIWPMPEILRQMGWEAIEFNSLCCELLIGDQKVWCDSCHWEDFDVKNR